MLLSRETWYAIQKGYGRYKTENVNRGDAGHDYGCCLGISLRSHMGVRAGVGNLRHLVRTTTALSWKDTAMKTVRVYRTPFSVSHFIKSSSCKVSLHMAFMSCESLF